MRIFERMSEEHIGYTLSKILRAHFLELDEAAAMLACPCTAGKSFTTAGVLDLSGGARPAERPGEGAKGSIASRTGGAFDRATTCGR